MKTKMYSVLVALIALGSLPILTSCEENKADEVSPKQINCLDVSEEGYTNINTSAMQDYFVTDIERGGSGNCVGNGAGKANRNGNPNKSGQGSSNKTGWKQ